MKHEEEDCLPEQMKRFTFRKEVMGFGLSLTDEMYCQNVGLVWI